MKPTMHPIHSLIDAKMLDRTQNIRSLTTSIHSRLSAELHQHCWVVDIIGNNLIMMTDKAERATTLRYQQHELLKQINEEFASSLVVPVRRLKVKVDHSLSTLASSSHKKLHRSESEISTAKAHCQQMLDYLENPLKEESKD